MNICNHYLQCCEHEANLGRDVGRVIEGQVAFCRPLSLLSTLHRYYLPRRFFEHDRTERRIHSLSSYQSVDCFHAATRGTPLSTNRRNRWFRAPATNDNCESSAGTAAEVFAFWGTARRDRLLRPPATKKYQQKQHPTPRVRGAVRVRNPARATEVVLLIRTGLRLS